MTPITFAARLRAAENKVRIKNVAFCILNQGEPMKQTSTSVTPLHIAVHIVVALIAAGSMTSCIPNDDSSETTAGVGSDSGSDGMGSDTAADSATTDSDTDSSMFTEAWRNALAQCEGAKIPPIAGNVPEGVTGWNLMAHPHKDEILLRINDIKSDVDDVFFCGGIVGQNGVLMRYEFTTNTWTDLETGVPHALNHIWMNTGSEIVLVGDSGTILTYSKMLGTVKPFEDNPFYAQDGSGPDLSASWGNSTEDFYVLGANTFYHYHVVPSTHALFDAENPDKPVWEPLTPPPVAPGAQTSDLSFVFAPDPRVVYGTQSSRILRWEDGEWTVMAREYYPNSIMRGLWGFNQNDIFAFGVGAEALQYDGVEWTPWTTDGMYTFDSLYAIWGTSHSNLYAGSDDGKIYFYNGSYWSSDNTSANGLPIVKIWGFGPDKTDVIASDGNNQIFRYEYHDRLVGEYYTLLDSGNTQYITSVTADNQGNVYAAGVTDETGSAYPGTPVIYRLDASGNILFRKTIPVTQTEWIADMVFHNQQLLLYASVTKPGTDTVEKFLRIHTVDLDGNPVGDAMDVSIEEGDVYPENIMVSAAGNLVITGIASGSFHGETNSGMIEEGSMGTTPIAFDAFVIQLSPDGMRQWTRIFGVPDVGLPAANRSGETITGLTLDNQGNVYVAGYSSGVFADMAISPEDAGMPSQNQEIAYLLKFSDSGEWLEKKAYPVNDFGHYPTLGMDVNQHIYMAGAGLNRQLDGIYCPGECNYYEILNSELATVTGRLFGTSDNQSIQKLSIVTGGAAGEHLYVAGTSTGPYAGHSYAGSSDIFLSDIAAGNVLQGSLMYGGEDGDYLTDMVTDSNRVPVILMSTMNSLNGQAPPAGTMGYGIWKTGAIPLDSYAECRN